MSETTQSFTEAFANRRRSCSIGSGMNFFVSGQIGEKQQVRNAYKLIQGAGHRITHDWTLTDDFVDKTANLLEAGRRAELDIAGVVNADVYVLLSDNVNVGKGMYVELGAALALQHVNRKPEVFVVGPMNHLSIFYLHPAVKHRHSVEQVLDEISSRDPGFDPVQPVG